MTDDRPTGRRLAGAIDRAGRPLGSLRERTSSDLLVIAAWSVLTVLVVSLPVVRESVIRTLVAGSFLLFVPGYAVVAALFVRVDKLSLLERGAFSVGASLAVVGLTAIPLGETPALGVRTETVLALQLLLIAVFAAVAESRRRRLDPDERARPAEELRSLVERAWNGRSAIGGGDTVVQVAIALAVVVSVGATAYVIASPLPGERYTEFYALDPDGEFEDLPETATVGEDVEVLIGIANNEHRSTEYGIQAQIRDDDQRVLWVEEVRLEHAETYESVVELEPPHEGEIEFELLLFYGDAPGEPVDPESADRYLSIEISVTDE